jgi:DNA-binding transcriptional regulator WhiA
VTKMSFSYDIKQELNKNSNLANKEIVKYELTGYFISGNTNIINEKEIKFSTESDYNINRFSKLLANLDINHKIEVSRKNIYN